MMLGFLSALCLVFSTQSKKLTFYSSKMCPYAERCAIVLEELQIPHENIPIDLQNKPSWFLEINPKGKVPCISCEEEEGEGNKEILYESLIVNEYLAESFTAGTESLLPSSPFLRAKMRLVIDYLDSTLNKAFFAYFANSDEEKETALKESFDVSLDGMEKIMADGGTYMCGDSFTLADVSCLPFFERMAATLPHFKGYTFNKQRQ